MIAGLLICDHVIEEYQTQFGDYPEMFISLFPEFEWREYDVMNGAYPGDINDCDVYFTTGSRHSAYEDLDWIRGLEVFIRRLYDSEKYFIGVCFGHQVMGQAMGGVVEKSSKGWCVGVHQFDIIEKADWMIPMLDEIRILMMCQDQIMTLPQGSRLLASNTMCHNAMFQLGDRFLGIQAHPEFSKEYDKLLQSLRVDRMGELVVRAGIKSLEFDLDTEVFKDWVFNFLMHGRN